MAEDIFSQRLLLFLRAKGWSKAYLANALGVRSQNISRYLKGDADPRKIIIKLIPHGLNLEWFLTGEGEMYTKKEVPEFAQAAGAEFAQKAGEEFARPAGAEFAKPAGAEFARSAVAEFAKPAGAEFARPAGAEFAQKAPYSGADAATASAPAHSPPVHQPVNAQLTPAQQTINANADAITIKNSPYFYEAIGRRLALHEENIQEGDILIIDPTITPLQGDLTLRGTDDGPEFTRFQPQQTNTKGVVVSLTRQYPAIHRQQGQ